MVRSKSDSWVFLVMFEDMKPIDNMYIYQARYIIEIFQWSVCCSYYGYGVGQIFTIFIYVVCMSEEINS